MAASELLPTWPSKKKNSIVTEEISLPAYNQNKKALFVPGSKGISGRHLRAAIIGQHGISSRQCAVDAWRQRHLLPSALCTCYSTTNFLPPGGNERVCVCACGREGCACMPVCLRMCACIVTCVLTCVYAYLCGSLATLGFSNATISTDSVGAL